MSRKPKNKDFEGKKIIKVDVSAINSWTFCFDDGTSILIEVEAIGHGLYGMLVTPIKDRNIK